MLHFILGPSGSGKTTWIRQRIVEASRERQGGILYLVPEQNNFESERAVLTLLGSMSTDVIEVVSFTRLAEWALGLSGQVKEAAPDSVKVMVMGRALREIEDELKLYKRQVGSTEFCRCVLELDEELRRARIPADKLLEAASGVGGTFEERVRELSLLIETYRGKLQNRFRDPLEDLDRLTEVLDRERPFVGKTVFIDSFKGFTEQQFSVLERLICQAEDVYLALLTDGRKDLDSGLGLFSNVKRTAATLARIAKDHAVPVAPDVCLTEDHRFGGNRLLNVERFLRGAAPDEDAQGGFLTVCACANVVDEADYVARTIRRLVRTEGYRYRDFAVVARHIEECQAHLVNACERYKIPCFNDRRIEADSLALIRFTLNAVDCAISTFPNDAVFPLIKSELSPLTLVEGAELERYALTWRKRGSDWLDDWEENPAGLDADFDGERLARILDARSRVTEPIRKLGFDLRSGDPKKACRGIYNMLQAFGVGEKLRRYADRLDAEGNAYGADLHRRSWDVVMAALDAVVRATEGETCEAKEIFELLSLMLSASDLGAIPDRLDEVVIGSADHIRMGSPRVVFAIGANYGVFPAAVKQGGLLSSRDRRALRRKLDLPDFAVEQTVDERFMVYAVLTAASEQLFITYRRGDVQGNKMLPADFVGQISAAFPDIEITNSSQTADDAFEGVLPAVERVCGARPELAEALSERLREREDPRAALLSAALRPSASASLSPATAEKLFGVNVRMSASRAETYEKCPFSFFCKYGVEAKPDPSADWAGNIRGSLVHAALESMMCKYGVDLSVLTPDRRRKEIQSFVDAYADARFGKRERLSADFDYRIERAVLTVDDILARLTEEQEQSRFRPDRFELPIGKSGYPCLSVPIPDDSGGSVVLNGKIDRVDVYREGDKFYLRIVDYKTGDETFDLADLLDGAHMQMLFYLFAVLGDEAYRGALPAGVLYQPARRSIAAGEAADRAKEQDKDLRMRGLLIEDDDSLRAMERDLQARFIPYPRTRSEKHNAIVSPEDFEVIRTYILHRIAELGVRLHRGEIGVHPRDEFHSRSEAESKSACRYCDYASVCRFDPEPKVVGSLSTAEAMSRMKTEVTPDEV